MYCAGKFIAAESASRTPVRFSYWTNAAGPARVPIIVSMTATPLGRELEEGLLMARFQHTSDGASDVCWTARRSARGSVGVLARGVADPVVGDQRPRDPAAQVDVGLADVAFDPTAVAAEDATTLAVGDDDGALLLAALVERAGEGMADTEHAQSPSTHSVSLSWSQRTLASW